MAKDKVPKHRRKVKVVTPSTSRSQYAAKTLRQVGTLAHTMARARSHELLGRLAAEDSRKPAKNARQRQTRLKEGKMAVRALTSAAKARGTLKAGMRPRKRK